jgi:GNAT superfamily N-acetyltransferase
LSEPTRIRADIIPFTLEFSSLVRSWIDSEDTLRNLTRSGEYPPQEEIVESWQRKDVSSYLLFSEHHPIAYGELWPRPVERAVEIAHLLVAPANRSQGYGSKMLQLLFERASQGKSVLKILLNLYSTDEEILGCYLKAGFELAGTTKHTAGLKMVRMVR